MEKERRAPGIKRVPLETLVEICGRKPGTPAFEAESIEVSGRGMHVRTAYLPDERAPLVLRFESGGKEILVEGEVAWAEAHGRGGEFGIRFTALDAHSVDALRDLIGEEDDEAEEEPEEEEVAEAQPAPEPEPRREAASRAPQTAPYEEPAPAPKKKTRRNPGTKVRLHIEGLGSPMKAQVRKGGSRYTEVGSKLEFLKLGRHLHLEDLDDGLRSGASIDTVDVVIDPDTQVPQLVVSLTYDEPLGPATPVPAPAATKAPTERSHVPTKRGVGPAPEPQVEAQAAATDAEADNDEYGDLEGEEYDDDFEGELDEEELEEGGGVLHERFGVVADGAGRMARQAGGALKVFGSRARDGMGGLFQSASKKVAGLRKGGEDEEEGEEAPPRRRQTSMPPSGVLSADGRRLRPQSQARPTRRQGEPPATRRAGAPSQRNSAAPQRGKAPASKAGKKGKAAPKKTNIRRMAAGGGAALLLVTVGVLALRGPSPDDDAPKASAEVPAAAGVAPGSDVMEVDEQGNPIQASAEASPEGEAEKSTQLAPKKLPPQGAEKASAATPEGITADVPLFGPTPMATTELAPLGDLPEAVDDTAPVEDESWDDAKKVDPSSVPPWGNGKVNTPTIHRLRLDKPGGAIQGAITATGFTVVIPGRKVMEQGGPIAKRDSRIARVSTKNNDKGAHITFKFKTGTPGYKVRLRKDFVEFLISAPKGKKVAAN